MPNVYLTNAFSLQMLPEGSAQVSVGPLALEAARQRAQSAQSRVGHASTAALFQDALGVPVAVDRSSITLTSDDALLVAQYVGPRLAEGAVTLPAGASLRWVWVTWQPVGAASTGPAPDSQSTSGSAGHAAG